MLFTGRESYPCLRPFVMYLHREKMIFCVGKAMIMASTYPKMATSIAHWRELVTIKATVPKNKASDGAGNAATDKRRTHSAAFCCVMVKSNIHVAEIKNARMARKNRSLNTIVASPSACFAEVRTGQTVNMLLLKATRSASQSRSLVMNQYMLKRIPTS